MYCAHGGHKCAHRVKFGVFGGIWVKTLFWVCEWGFSDFSRQVCAHVGDIGGCLVGLLGGY